MYDDIAAAMIGGFVFTGLLAGLAIPPAFKGFVYVIKRWF